MKADKPFFLWFNSTRMHIWTHLKKESEGKTGLGIYPDGMVEHDGHVGQLLDKLDELGIADNTIVMYSTDNGAECFSWPDGGSTPFRNEKNSNWEGGYRVPCMIRWPGVIKPGTMFNGICSHEDMLPTLLAAAGEPDINEKLIKGHKANERDYKVHLDGYNLIPYFKGEVKESHGASSSTGPTTAASPTFATTAGRSCSWSSEAHGLDVWQEPLAALRFPKLFCLRTDPVRAGRPRGRGLRPLARGPCVRAVARLAFVAKHLETYKDFPPRQKPGSFNPGSGPAEAPGGWRREQISSRHRVGKGLAVQWKWSARSLSRCKLGTPDSTSASCIFSADAGVKSGVFILLFFRRERQRPGAGTDLFGRESQRGRRGNRELASWVNRSPAVRQCVKEIWRNRAKTRVRQGFNAVLRSNRARFRPPRTPRSSSTSVEQKRAANERNLTAGPAATPPRPAPGLR